jgi:sigma-E factor negative regulatory protein RseA
MQAGMGGKVEAMDKMDNQELISALADGQLRGDDFARAVRLAAGDAEGRRTWHAYHLIGEVLRSGRPASGTAPEVFLARLQRRLQQEPGRAVVAMPVAAEIRTRSAQPAANDWRWKLVAGFASVAAVAAVGWNMYGAVGAPSGQPQLAAVPAGVIPVAADPRAAAMIRDPRLDQLLQAHRQFGGATALQNPSGFLRNATFEGPAR